MIAGCEGDCRGCSQKEKEDCWEIAQDLLMYGVMVRGISRIWRRKDEKKQNNRAKIRVKGEIKTRG